MSAAALRDLLRSIPALLFPDRCACCDSLSEGPFCAPCADTLMPVPAGCPLCGEPGDEALLPALRPRRCARCQPQRGGGSAWSTTSSPRERRPPRLRGPFSRLGQFASKSARLHEPERCVRLPARLAGERSLR